MKTESPGDAVLRQQSGKVGPGHEPQPAAAVAREREREAAAPPPARRSTSLAARGEPFVWVLTAGQIAAVLMITGFVALILYQGFRTFWPREVVCLSLTGGGKLLGEVTRSESYRPYWPGEPPGAAGGGEAASAGAERVERRQLVRTGNYDLYGDDFRWVPLRDIAAVEQPLDAVTVERLEWGAFFGFLEELQIDGLAVNGGRDEAWGRLQEEHGKALELRRRIRGLEKGDIGGINHELEANRLKLRRLELEHGRGSPEYQAGAEQVAAGNARLEARYQELAVEVEKLKQEDGRRTALFSEVGGRQKSLKVSEIVRVYRSNRLTLAEKLGVYASRWWEFLSGEPREANTEGGVFPAIFGTVTMTMLMALAVTPFGILAALYLREYARQGMIVSAVRIAVNNLAGVPSIVFGVFGLGFFCYVVGGTIDQVLFPERLPAPTFGTGGVLWASLTLALMTVPVVIVATEEALAAVPRSMREGAYACGASKWQMVRRVVLPKALPGIMTGIVLAMARGAGEVAPLMITGVVKLAPELAVDGRFPFIHLERSFMHLGFHIYDVGFQSRNAEAGKPMVFTATLLLLSVILLMNISVIGGRARLKRKFQVEQF